MPFYKTEKIFQDLVENNGERWTEEMRRDLPHSFHRHGDLILLGDNCFTLPLWNKFGIIVSNSKLSLILSTSF